MEAWVTNLPRVDWPTLETSLPAPPPNWKPFLSQMFSRSTGSYADDRLSYPARDRELEL